MENICKITNKSGSISWQISWTTPEGKRKRKSYSTLKEAKTNLAYFNHTISKGTYDDPARYDKIRLIDLVEKYTEIHGDEKCFRTSKRFFIQHIIEFFQKDRLLKTIQYDDLQKFQKYLKNKNKKRHERSDLPPIKLKTATINRIFSCLRHMFREALSWNMIAKNPFMDGGSLQEKENNLIRRYLTQTEINLLLAASEDYLRDIIQAAILSALRRTELLSLKWEQIDFEQGVVNLPETKTGEEQFIPLGNDLRKLLNRIKLKHRNRGIESDFVFLWKNFEGEFTPITDCKTAFSAAVERAGMIYGRNHPQGVTFHILRHSSIKHIYNKTKSLGFTQGYARHRSPLTTRRYAQDDVDNLREAADSLNGICVDQELSSV